MAKKKSKSDSTKQPGDKKQYSDYPIKTLFQVSMLIASIAFILMYISNPEDIITSVYRAFIIFAVCAIFGGAIMLTIVSMLGNVREREAEETRSRIEQEQREFLESQMRLQEEINKLNSENFHK
jgi:hypothetical protein